MKKILHLNADYIGNHLYSMILSYLDSYYTQLCYVPIKWNRKPKFEIPLLNGIILFRQIIRKYHRFLYFNKINTIIKDIKREIKIQKISLIHAHSVFTDGAVALNLKETYGIKYIVAVRLTDVVLQYKYMYHRRWLANKVLKNAEKVIFISPLYQKRFLSYLPNNIKNEVLSKSCIVPNGIDNYFLQNSNSVTPYIKDECFNILFIGRIISTKNINKLVSSVKSLAKEMKISLTVVGGGIPAEQEYFDEFRKEIDGVPFINYLDEIYDKSVIVKLYSQSHLLAVPSKEELFGLVYVESISQNTPFIYGINTGIEPYFKSKYYCMGVNGSDTQSIKRGIKDLKSKYNSFIDFANDAKEFSWDNIINKYKSIYNELD